MKFIKFIIITLFLISCKTINNKNNSQLRVFNLKELPKISVVKLSDLGFVDIEYIPLETTPNCVISHILKIEIGNGFYLIQNLNKIYEFQNDGSFVSKIGTEGRGPNEYTVAHDIDIERRNQNIYLVSAWQKKFFVYTEYGDFLRTFHSPQNTINFRVTKDGILCYNSNVMANTDISYNLIDTLGRTIKNFSNKYPWTRVGTSLLAAENLYYRFDNRLFKKEIYSDTIYTFEDKEFKPHLVIEQGGKLLTPEARSKYGPEYLSEHYIIQTNLFEFGDYIYYEFSYDFKIGGQNFYRGFIGSKKNNSQVLIDASKGLINDLDNGPNIILKSIKDDNTIISWVDALELKKLVASEDFNNSNPKYPERKKELEKLAKKIKESDNPIIVLVKLKK